MRKLHAILMRFVPYARTPSVASWSGDLLLRALSNARSRVLAAGRERVSGADEVLPPLNPS